MLRLTVLICCFFLQALPVRAQSVDELQSWQEKAKAIAKAENPQKALEFLETKIKTANPQEAEGVKELISCYKMLGTLAIATGDDDRALAFYRKGLSVYYDSGLGPFKGAAFTYGEMGLISYRRGDYAKAREHFEADQQILVQCCEDETKGFGVVHYNLGNIEWMLENYAEATMHYKKALPLMESAYGQDHFIIGTIYNNLGGVAWDQKNKEQAVQYFSLAAEHELQRKGEITDPGGALAKKGDSLIEGNSFSQALEYYRGAYEARQRDLGAQNPYTIGCLTYMAAARSLTGDLQQSLHLYDSAIAGFTGAEQAGETIGSWRNVSSAALLLDALAGKLQVLLSLHDRQPEDGYLTQAFETASRTEEIVDHLRMTAVAEASKLHWSQKVMPFYENAIDASYRLWVQTRQPEYFNSAFRFSEKAKAFLLSQSLSGLSARKVYGLPDSVLHKEQLLQMEIARLERLILNEQNKCDRASSQRLTAWRNQQMSLKQKQAELQDMIQSEYSEYYQLKFEQKVPSRDELLRSGLAGEGSGFIEYFLGEKWLFIFYTDHHYLILNKQPVDPTLAEHNVQFLQALNNYNYLSTQPEKAFHKFTTSGYQLYEKLLDPILKQNPKVEQLIIVPDGWLYYLPFEVLLTAPAQPDDNYATLPYLLNKYLISYVPSATVALQQLQRPGKGKAYSYSGFAPAYENDSRLASTRQPLSPLRFNVQEVEGSARLFSGEPFTGAEATKKAFFIHAAESGILHLAMHTVVEDEEPLLSSFAFATMESDSTRLYTYELYNLPMNAQLAILSGCQTGMGKLQRGEGVMSLAHGFSYAGCPSVLMSLWQVDDQATSAITTGFLRNLRQGMKKNEALRQAKQSYLAKADPAAAHPFYWAGLVLIGDSRPLDMGNSLWWVWVLVGTVVLIGIIVFIRRN